MSIRKWISAVAIAAVFAPAPASALDPKIRLTQDRHTAWRVQDGFFAAAPTAIAQTADGYIWIGTGAGLVKYDGVRFVPWIRPGDIQPFSAAVHSLLAASDGTLWIGTAAGLLSWKSDKLEQHVRGRINEIIEDRHHRVWIARSRTPDATGGLCVAAGEKPRCVGGDDRLRLPHAVTVSEDVHGNLWVGSSSQLLRWRHDSHQSYFREQLARFEGLEAVASVIGVSDGSVWAAIPREGFGVFRTDHGTPEPMTFKGTSTKGVHALYVDRDQSVWMGTTNDGIYRAAGARLEVFRSESGLSGNAVTKVFEDREGNLWVATSKGLDRFRNPRVVTFSTAEGLAADLAASVLAADDGRVWIGNQGGLDVVDGDRVTSIRTPGQNVTSLFQDRVKRVWVGLDQELAVYQDGRFQKVKSLDGSTDIGIATAITEDSEGNLFVSIAAPKRRLVRVRDFAVQEEFPIDRIPYSRVLAADPVGGIWLGHLDGKLGHLQAGKLEAFALPHGNVPVSGLMIDSDGSVWVSSAGGLTRWKNREATTLTTRNGLPCDRVISAIRDLQAVMWLYTACGLIAIENAALESWSQRPTSTIEFRVFDVLDGAMPGNSTFQPGVSKSPNGRLWFVNDAVVQMLDPSKLRMNSIAPPVYVEALHADRKEHAINAAVRLPARSRDIEISYTALSFSVPEKVRFRYRLEGRDQVWSDAGTRRQVFYSDLPPGRYRFNVTASNNDGVWNEQGATLAFVVAPAYYQTGWFIALAAGVLLTAVWTAHRVRLRIVEKNQRDMSALNERLMKAQEQERVRIAGELHDGVMQEMLAATMLLGTAKRRTPDDSEAQGTIDKVQQKLIRMGADLRQLSHELHPPALQEAGLPKAVEDYCEEFAAASSIPISCHTDSGVDDLSRGTSLALFRILQEALGNAAKHSHAKQITVRLSRDGGTVSLIISDDGVGFDRNNLGPSRGLGLITIRERAGQLNGTFEFNTAPGRGTAIRVAIPFR